jgi:hypothetical protein
MTTTPCPGCGLTLPERLAPPPPEHGASSACFSLYGRALEFESRRFAQPPAGRLLLDAYGAQHPVDGGRMARDNLAVHLIGLHLALIRHIPPDAMPSTLRRVLRGRRDFPALDRPASFATHNVTAMFGPDGAPIEDLDAHVDAARAWASSVWESWSDQHGLVARWVRESGVFGDGDD